MIKTTMLATLIAGLAMGANLASGSRPLDKLKDRDTELIIEVDRSLETLTHRGVLNTQKIIENRIRNFVTSNIRVTTSFDTLANAFTITIPHEYAAKVKDVPGVKSVTKNELHWVTYANQNDGLEPLIDGGSNPSDYGGQTNISAVTMKKPGANESLPGTTNEGEGTVIAILDNEFYFRAEHTENDATIPSWYHETFSPLAESVVKRFDFKTTGTDEEIAASKAEYLELVEGTHAAVKHPTSNDDENVDYDVDPDKATKVKNTPLGKEGSLYFNSKVPFYFDYGGEKKIHSDYISHDFDVSSEISYHGSHVASIASGNADNYKGIAPNAQLVCMKVFTNFKPNKVEEAVGLQPSTGAYDIPILRALEDCMKLGVDGINMSLGSNLNDFDQDSITVKILKELATSGILTSISAGNDGKSSYSFAGGYGSWTFDTVESGILSGYANQADSMTIASGQPTRKFYENAFKMGDAYIEFEDQVKNRDGMPDDFDIEHEMKDLIDPEHPDLTWVYVPGFGTDADYAGLDNVAGNIAVVKRGSTSFSDKYKVAFSKGAVGLVVINNDPTASSFNMRMSFGDDQPEIPVAFVLYSDMPKFGLEGSTGTFRIINDEIGDNIRAYTTSSFSSDGATFDLQLKPEITAPGENIRGAVPPQKKEDREAHQYGTYEFLSGTSMSAPNYAGAQSVILSKVAKSTFSSANPDLNAYYAYRDTVNMRLMSTAMPMRDFDYDPEVYYNSGDSKIEVLQLTSPRIQGAGMANIGAAYNTDVYLEGLNAAGEGIGKSKVELRNNDLINNGTIKISFIGHNESEQNRNYGVKLTVLRPAVKHSTDIVTKEYNNLGDVTQIEDFPGRTYYTWDVVSDDSGWHYEAVAHMSQTGFAHNDVYKVTKDITYWDTAADCALDHPSDDESTWTEIHKTTLSAGRYYNAGDEEEAVWLPLPDHAYQSTQDTLIAEIDLADLVIEPGDKTYNLESYSLSAEAKADIAEYFTYGCYIEGYVSLTSKDGKEDLSVPYMGFYAGQGKSYESAPVVEPFSFEKDPSQVYPSDLVNDLTKTLLGLSNVDFGSEWITTYVQPGTAFNQTQILENKESLTHLCEMDDAYHLVGTDLEGNRYTDPENNIYVGNPNFSNTMIMQQFVLRSVADNYFTIKNQAGDLIYKDALQDMLFGDELHSWNLYKSHVDATYLGGGYVAHRAFAVIPLYDDNGQAFASGKYTIEFNYKLAATGNWVSKSYNIIVDSDAPTVSDVVEDGDNLRINITEANLAGLSVGSYDFTDRIQHDSETDSYYITLGKVETIELLNESLNRENGTGRLFIGMTDRSYGYTGAIIKFNKKDKDAKDHYDADVIRNNRYIPLFNNYTIAESPIFELRHDLEDLGSQINFFTLDARGNPSMYYPDGYVKITRFPERKSNGGSSSNSGCGGNILTTSITLSALAGVLAISLIIAKKKRKFGGQE